MKSLAGWDNELCRYSGTSIIGTPLGQFDWSTIRDNQCKVVRIMEVSLNWKAVIEIELRFHYIQLETSLAALKLHNEQELLNKTKVSAVNATGEARTKVHSSS